MSIQTHEVARIAVTEETLNKLKDTLPCIATGDDDLIVHTDSLSLGDCFNDEMSEIFKALVDSRFKGDINFHCSEHLLMIRERLLK